MEELSFTIYENGLEIVYDIIATYHDDDSNKDYVVYTDKQLDKNNSLNLFYSLYSYENNKLKLLETNELEDKKVGLELIKEIGMLLSK